MTPPPLLAQLLPPRSLKAGKCKYISWHRFGEKVTLLCVFWTFSYADHMARETMLAPWPHNRKGTLELPMASRATCRTTVTSDSGGL